MPLSLYYVRFDLKNSTWWLYRAYCCLSPKSHQSHPYCPQVFKKGRSPSWNLDDLNREMMWRRQSCGSHLYAEIRWPTDGKLEALHTYLKSYKLHYKGVAREGPGVHVTPPPPLVSLFVSKPTIFRWQSGEYPLYDSVWTPFKKSWLRPCIKWSLYSNSTQVLHRIMQDLYTDI